MSCTSDVLSHAPIVHLDRNTFQDLTNAAHQAFTGQMMTQMVLGKE